MKKYLIAFVLLVASCTSGCTNMQIPALSDATEEVARIKGEVDATAEKLSQTLDVVERVMDVALGTGDFVCEVLGVDSKTCQHVMGVAKNVDAEIDEAQDAIDAYQETGEGFDNALRAVKEASDKVMAFKLLVESLYKSIE